MIKRFMNHDSMQFLNSLHFPKFRKKYDSLFNILGRKTYQKELALCYSTHSIWQLKGPISLQLGNKLKTVHVRSFAQQSLLSLNDYNSVVEKTLEELADQFDYFADHGYFSESYDSLLADGVLTLKLAEHVTYVLNKQTPNRQLWLSSPESGPRRYDFVENTWIYSHDPSDTLHEFLSKELQTLCKREIDLSHLTYAKRS